MKSLIYKTVKSFKNEGVRATLYKCRRYIKDQIPTNTSSSKDKRYFVDVLFINGCALPHPARYRVTHQAEQLLMANVTSSTVFYEDLDLSWVNYARVFIFFRCPHTEIIENFIIKAKQYNKTVIFDIDDLVFDTYYTNQVRYVQQMQDDERKLYDNGVIRMGKTLSLCDIATTTTEALAQELTRYVKTVYINRNVASENMLSISEGVITERNNMQLTRKVNVGIVKAAGEISLGYFSGSITHNDDFAIILPAILQILEEYKNVHLYLVGEIELPESLKKYGKQIHFLKFMEWNKLPYAIGQMDINLAPLEDTLFNCAKSENKWVEASLVKVVTVASRVGAFSEKIEDGVTGVLCENTRASWYEKLKTLIEDKDQCDRIANNAYIYVKNNAITLETCYSYAKFIRKMMTSNLIFKIPTAQISGGILVAQRHAMYLQRAGIDVSFIHDGSEEKDIFQYEDSEFPVLRSRSTEFLGSLDMAVATLYTTMEFIQNYPNIKRRMYLVQGLETLFSNPGEWNRVRASQTYIPNGNIDFITVSRWCQKWLKEKYEISSRYIPNGIDCNQFYPEKRMYSGKIRILVEGNSDDPNKNIDESFQIINNLDFNRFEVWYVSYQGKAKPWYHVDRFFRRVPNTEMPRLYRACHILLKSSFIESFSYPPLEMMATGGIVIVRPNDGNREYLVDKYNCLFYDPQDLDTAINAINKVISSEKLRQNLISNGIKTSKERTWKNIEAVVVNEYLRKN